MPQKEAPGRTGRFASHSISIGNDQQLPLLSLHKLWY
jgi:hypothetical protein